MIWYEGTWKIGRHARRLPVAKWFYASSFASRHGHLYLATSICIRILHDFWLTGCISKKHIGRFGVPNGSQIEKITKITMLTRNWVVLDDMCLVRNKRKWYIKSSNIQKETTIITFVRLLRWRLSIINHRLGSAMPIYAQKLSLLGFWVLCWLDAI